MREGTDFQARIPLHLPRRPSGREQDHPRAGLPGPSTLEALAIAAGFEKDSSDSLHIDAVADPEYHPGQGGCPSSLIWQRLSLIEGTLQHLAGAFCCESMPCLGHPIMLHNEKNRIVDLNLASYGVTCLEI